MLDHNLPGPGDYDPPEGKPYLCALCDEPAREESVYCIWHAAEDACAFCEAAVKQDGFEWCAGCQDDYACVACGERVGDPENHGRCVMCAAATAGGGA